MAERKNPLDLSGFTPRPAAATSRPAPEVVEQISQETGFPSRQPAGQVAVGGSNVAAVARPRTTTGQATDNRRRTGRNIQKGVKLTAQGVIDLEAEARYLDEPFGEVLERGIAAIRKLREMGIEDYYP
ncbi:hypothetical protein [Burkholderia pseudomultivorans]|uniref:hypothetical protein n=1 Tax=Burkholderia pseudomultivorans TaxID=1207504 RepID=UPI000B127772|nr:hypothetical protein [Burkholderia pseudomultivorans]